MPSSTVAIGRAAAVGGPSTSRVAEASGANPFDVGGRLADLLFACAAGTLFIHDDIVVHLARDVQFRLPLNVPLMLLTSALTLVGFIRRSTLFASMSWTLLLFAVVHVASAARLGVVNAERELVQAATVFAFVLSFGARYSRASIRRFFLCFAPIAGAITVYNIGWHVGQGYYVSWKQLYNPKALFDLMPLMIVGYCLTRPKFSPVLAAALMLAAGGLILLSGERKAYIAFGFAILIMLNPKNAFSYLAPVAALAALYLGVKLTGSAYVARQVQTLLGFIGVGAIPDSLSDSERAWQFHLGMLFLRQNPLFGVGTNGFNRLSMTLYSANDYSQLGIHGELLRVLVEDGIVGLGIYLTYVAGAAVSLVGYGRRWRRPSAEQRIAILWLVSLIVYTSFEADNFLVMAMEFSMGFVGRINFGAADLPPLRTRLQEVRDEGVALSPAPA